MKAVIITDEEIARMHDPFEGQGGTIDCSCGWPRRADFEVVGRDVNKLDFSMHLLTVRRETP